jgi:hypothetical protein
VNDKSERTSEEEAVDTDTFLRIVSDNDLDRTRDLSKGPVVTNNTEKSVSMTTSYLKTGVQLTPEKSYVSN